MAYTWQQLTPAVVNNLYLYGQPNTPSNLVNDALIRPANAILAVQVDAVSFMNDGPGRFANPSRSPLVASFFTSFSPALDSTGVRREFTLAQMQLMLGLDDNFAYQQYNLGGSDVFDRTLIWNSSSFTLGSETKFIIEADGTRSIDNLSVRPFDDNYDFKSNNLLAILTNPTLKSWIDPSSIGRTVNFEFINKESIPLVSSYDYNDWVDDVELSQSQSSSAPSYGSIYSGISAIADQLWENGTTKFIDGNKPVIYGTVGSDNLDSTIADTSPYLRDLLVNGLVFVGGGGADIIKDSAGADIMVGGTDIDIADYSDTVGMAINLSKEDIQTATGTKIGYGIAINGRNGVDKIVEIEKIKLGTGSDTIKFGGDLAQFADSGTIEFVDLVNGGSKDTLDFSGVTGSVSLSGSGNSIQLGNMTFTNFERIIGSSRADNISIGSSDISVEVTGGEGDDIIKTGSGIDILDGGDDNDRLAGGGGADTFQFTGSFGRDVILDADGSDVLKVNGSVLGGGEREEGTDDPYKDGSGNQYFWNKRGDLLIKPAGSGTIVVQNFSNGKGGITLEETPDEDKDKGRPKDPKTPPRDPLVLDLDGDGVELIPIGSAMYDLDGDGIRESVGWVSPDDGLVVFDRNGNGAIEGLSELFGTLTENGFQVLEGEDSNGDGVINAGDANWGSLRIWKDLDSDGRTDSGELLTMNEAGVASIGLAHTPTGLPIGNGNNVQFTGTYTTTDGVARLAGAVLFTVNAYESQVEIPAGFTYPDGVLNLPEMNGSGQVADLSYAMAIDADLANAVRQLVANAGELNSKEFLAQFEQLMWKWAGVENTDPASRGPHVDGRHAAFLERIYGTDDLSDGWLGRLSLSNPSDTFAGGQIEGLYALLIDSLSVRFASQIAMSNMFLEDNFETAVSNPFWALATLTYDAETGIIGGKIEKIAAALVERAPSDPAEGVAYFEKTMPFLLFLAREFYVLGTGISEDIDWASYAADLRSGLSGLQDKALVEFAFELAYSSRTIIGTSGDDALVTEDYSGSFVGIFYASFVGGRGNDTLTGKGLYDDSYIFMAGDGHDTIYSHDAAAKDQLLLIGLDPADITSVERDVPALNDITMRFGTNGDAVTIKGFGVSKVLDSVVFADGTIWTQNDVLQRVLDSAGTSGNDVIVGFTFNDGIMNGKQGDDTLRGLTGGDTYVFRNGDGNDTVDDGGYASQWQIDKVQFLDGVSTELLIVRNGNDAVLSFSNDPGHSVRIIGQFSPDSFGEIERFQFANGVIWTSADLRARYLDQQATSGADSITGFAFNDIITGKEGNDALSGGSGDDTYVWRVGDGNDTITEGGIFSTDTLRLEGVVATEVSVVRSGVDLLVTRGTETITIKEQFGSLGWNVVERIEFSDATWSAGEIAFKVLGALPSAATLVGTPGDDTVNGTTGSDAISGGAGGDDRLVGLGGSDIYFWSSGDGNDTIEENGSGSAIDADVIRVGLAPSAVELSRIGNNLIIETLATGEKLTVLNQFSTSGASKAVERLIFADGTIWAESDIAARAVIRGTVGNDVLTGTNGDDILDGREGADTINGGRGRDTYLWSVGDGNDNIDETYSDAAALDRLVLQDVNAADVEFLGDAYDGDRERLVVRIKSTGEMIVDTKFYSTSTGRGLEEIQFQNGDVLTKTEIKALVLIRGTTSNDNLSGVAGVETFEGGQGDDYLVGGDGNNTFIWSAGDGSDEILDATYSAGDTLRLKGILPADVTLTRSDTTLLVRPGDGAVISAQGFFNTLNELSGIDRIVFDDGTIWERAQIIEHLEPPPPLNVIYAAPEGGYLSGTDGTDHFIGAGGIDTFYGAKGDDIFDGGDDGYDQVDLDGEASDWTFSSNPDGSVTAVRSGWGTLTLNDIDGIYFYGSQEWAAIGSLIPGHVNYVYASPDGGYLQGSDGDDHFVGDVGDDTFYGALGDDVFEGGAAGDDQVDLDGEVNDWVFSRNPDNTVTAVRDGWGTLTLKDIDGVFFPSSFQWWSLNSLAPPPPVTFTGTSDDDDITGTVGNDDIFGLAGNDTLTGDSGDDWLFGGTGHDLLRGGDGQDRLDGDDDDLQAGNDILLAGGGHDLLNGFAGNDDLYGEAGYDFIDGGLGDDQLVGGADSDTYVFRSGDGSDTINDFVGSTDDVDALRFTDLNASDLSLARVGEALKIVIIPTGETITVERQFYSATENWGIERFEFADGTSWDLATINANAMVDPTGDATVFGTSAAETVVGTAIEDIIFAQDGDDVITGGAGGDVFIYRSGDGSDTIDDQAGYENNVDVIRFTDLNAVDISLAQIADKLKITIISTGEVITVERHFYSTTERWGIERFDFADGTSWDLATINANAAVDPTGDATILGTSAAETVLGTAIEDIIFAQEGDDLVTGGAGGDVFIYRSGDGSDTIADEAGYTNNVDVLRFTDLNAADIGLTRAGDALKISIIPTGEVITVELQFYSTEENWGIERFDFADGTSWDLATINANAVVDPTGDATIIGTSAGETVLGTAIEDIIFAKEGDDAITGGAGGDVYIYRSGDGSDAIADEAGYTNNVDVLRFTDLNASDLSLTRVGDTLKIAIVSTGELIAVERQFYSTEENWGIERFDFADGTSWDLATINANAVVDPTGDATIVGTSAGETIAGTGVEDIIFGKEGNDLITGSAGGDIYIYRSGDGSDTIDDLAGYTDNVDVLRFTDLNAADISLVRDGDKLEVTVTATGEVVTVDHQFYSTTENWGIETFQFADGTSWDLATINASAIVDPNGAPTVIGTSGNDILVGSAGVDVILGDAGDDEITGGTNNDVFVFGAGFGKDTITDFVAGASTDDVIEFDDAVFADLTAVLAVASQVGVDTLISHDANNTITLKNVTMGNLHADDFRFA